MALLDQMFAVSYPAVLAEMRKPNNQWADHTGLKALDKFGFIKRINLGDGIEVPIDYRPNPDAAVLASDQDTNSLIATDIISTTQYVIGQLNVPVTWTKMEEVKNPTENQKVGLVRSKLENGIATHDDLFEQLIFTSSVAGGDEFNGLADLVPTSGQGTVGGIDAGVEVFWRNPVDTYTDASDIEAGLLSVWNDILKGSDSDRMPKLLLSGNEPNALYESQLQGQRRYGKENTASGGFDAIFFKNTPWVWSQYGDEKVYFLNPKDYNLLV